MSNAAEPSSLQMLAFISDHTWRILAEPANLDRCLVRRSLSVNSRGAVLTRSGRPSLKEREATSPRSVLNSMHV